MIERFFIAIISFNYPTKNQASLSPEIFLYYLEFQTLIKFPNKLQKKQSIIIQHASDVRTLQINRKLRHVDFISYFVQIQTFNQHMIRKFSIYTMLLVVVVSFNICELGSYWSEYERSCVECGGGCQRCDQNGCQKYEDRISVKEIKRRLMLTRCGDIQCKTCINSTCTQCIDGYASNGGSMNCQRCHSTCLTCTTPNNDGTCSSCQVGRYLDASNYCIRCNSAFTANCLQCNPAECTVCVNGTMPDPSGPNCISCGSIANCQTCDSTGCVTCQQYYQVFNNSCTDICGDSYIITLPCDNPKYIPYDGCDDSCSVMPNFYCNVTSDVCSFAGQLIITQISLTKPEYENKLELVVSLFPPLYAFTNTDLNQLFFVNQTELHVEGLVYVDGQLTVMMSFTTHVVDKPFQLLFQPSSSTDPRFQITPAQKLVSTVSTTNSAYFYSSADFTIAKVLWISSYILVGLTWSIFLLAIFSNKLAGLQLLFILQYFWVSLFFLPEKLPLPYLMAVPLKYSSGYALTLTTATHKTSLPIQSQQFKTDINYFQNNFNLAFIFYGLPILGALICKLISCSQKYKDAVTPKLEFFIEMTLYGVMANLIGFTLFSFIFFSSGQISHVPSLIIFSLSVLITVGTLIKFFFDPDPFNRFRYSFNNQALAFNHYYLHTINLVAMVLLLGLFPTLTWVCCIPVGLILLQTIFYRPYKELSQNLRSFYYHLLMLLTVVLRLLYCMKDRDWRTSDLAGLLLIVLLCGLYVIAVIWAYVEVIRDLCRSKQSEQSPQKQKLQYTLFQDLKLMKQISNPQKFMQLTGINPMKSFAAGGGGVQTSRHSAQAYSNVDQENQQYALKNRHLRKQQKNMITQSEEQNYPETGHSIKITTPKSQIDNQRQNIVNVEKLESKNNMNNMNKQKGNNYLKGEEGGEKGEGGEKNWDYNENDVKLIVNNQNSESFVEQKPPTFKVNNIIKPVFPTFFQDFGLLPSPTANLAQNMNASGDNAKIQKEENLLQQMDQAKKMMIKNLLKKQIRFVKMKNAEDLIKPKDQKLLEIYQAI